MHQVSLGWPHRLSGWKQQPDDNDGADQCDRFESSHSLITTRSPPFAPRGGTCRHGGEAIYPGS